MLDKDDNSSSDSSSDEELISKESLKAICDPSFYFDDGKQLASKISLKRQEITPTGDEEIDRTLKRILLNIQTAGK